MHNQGELPSQCEISIPIWGYTHREEVFKMSSFQILKYFMLYVSNVKALGVTGKNLNNWGLQQK